MSAFAVRVLDSRTLQPGDIQIETTALPRPAIVVFAGPQYATAHADRLLSSVQVHRGMERIRATLNGQAAPWAQQTLVWILESDSVTIIASDATH